MLTRGESTATSLTSQARMLNDHFTSPTTQIPSTAPPPGCPALSSVDCDEEDVLELIVGMKRKVASGPDGISSAMLKGCAGAVVRPLTSIFVKSLTRGKVPSGWKASNVTPIFKSGDRSEAKNYRPISLLPLCSKILERIVHNALLAHVLPNGLLTAKQYGFRPGSSTQEALLAATRDWLEVLERKGSVACVYFDLAKAFDTLPHTLIMDSLAGAGVSGTLLDWFEDYLTNRSQCVVLEGVASGPASVTSGVPQGSILGPLLFTLAINTLADIPVSITTTVAMFADDTLLYKPVFSRGDLVAFQSDIHHLVDWVKARKLRLNVGKTKSMLISRKRKREPLVLEVDGTVIEEVGSVKYLGVTVTSDLTWNEHITNICARGKRLTGFLYRSFRQADVQTLSRLYRALVRPCLEYCGAVWDPHQLHLITKLERVQGFAAKVATRRWDTGGLELAGTLGWPGLAARRSYFRICVCRRILRGLSIIPPDAFTPHPAALSVRHQNSAPLFRPFASTNYRKQAFFIGVVPLWNAIPDSIISLATDMSFKRQLRAYLVL